MVRRYLIFGLLAIAFALAGCGEAEKTDDTSSDQAQRPTSGMAEILAKPSGVRYQDLVIGTGPEVVDSMLVKFDYSVWFANQSGMEKVKAFASSKGSYNLKYRGQVGVTPMEGLSDGLRGMKLGGIRRIFIPSRLGYGPDGPGRGANLIFEVENLDSATFEEFSEFQEQERLRREYYKHRNDSIMAYRDSMGIGPDSTLPPELQIMDTTGN